jgi:putative two-component system response regulator
MTPRNGSGYDGLTETGYGPLGGKRLRSDQLERLVEERTVSLCARISELRTSRMETIRCLAKAIALRDSDTSLHTERIGTLSALLARRVGWTAVDAELLRLASPMHDVGKIAIPDSILRKPGPLTEEEKGVMQRHTEIGHAILSESSADLLRQAAAIALTHHEKFDGSGYPQGLAGEEIPLEGRIVAVADVFDALLSDRVYRPAQPMEIVLETMQAGRGSHFDPEIIDRLFDNLDEVAQLAGTWMSTH